MALTTTPLGRKLQFDTTEQTDTINVPDVNVRAGPTTLYALDVDNILTSGALGYVKLFDSSGAGLAVDVAAGNARAKIVIPVPAVSDPIHASNQEKGRTLMMTPNGLAFVNGLCWLASDSAGNVAGSAPTIDLRVQAITQEAA